MIITTTVYLTADGGIRLATRSDSTPKKGELTATLELDVPEALFAPQSVTLRATVAGPAPAAVTAARAPVRSNGNGNGHQPPRIDADATPWTATRIRRAQSLAGLDDETFARRLNVSLQILHAWKTATKLVTLGAADAAKLEAIEAEAVTA
jgi:hypothetical protein